THASRATVTYAERRGELTPDLSPAAPGQPDDRLGIRLGRAVAAPTPGRRRTATGAATACRRDPAVARRSVLHHAGVGAEHVAAEILRARVAEVLAVLERRIVDLDQRVLVARVVLRPSGEAREIVVAQ